VIEAQNARPALARRRLAAVVRSSMHRFNTEAELDRLGEVVAALDDGAAARDGAHPRAERAAWPP
jgi:selenocysteine lyase/cysteine desulfurase